MGVTVGTKRGMAVPRNNWFWSVPDDFNVPTRISSDRIDVTLRYLPTVVRPAYNAVFTIPEEPSEPPPPPFDEAYIRGVDSQYSDSCWSSGQCGYCAAIRVRAGIKYSSEFNKENTQKLANWRKNWARLWHNIAIAHTAACFILEVNWDGEQQKFINESTITSFIS